MKHIFDLTDKVAIVTGGYGYLGFGITNALLAFGAKVIVAGRSEEKFNEKFKNSQNDNLHFLPFDIKESSDIYKEKFNEVKNNYKSLDIVFNNAYSSRGNNQEDILDDDWAFTMDGVLGSVHRSIKACMPIMKEQKFGKIINIASMYGHISPNFEKLYTGGNCEKYINPPHYGAAKAGVIQLTKYYATLLGKYNIYVNSISPGPFSSRIIQEENPYFIERLKDSNPLHKLGTPKDLAGISILLSSQASDFITGQNFAIDGGWTIW